MSRRSILFAFIGLLIFTCSLKSQEQLNLSLPEVVALAQSDAPDVLIAQTRLNNRYWRFQSHLANYRPQINLEADAPNLNRSIEKITIPDGSDIFINRSLMSNSIGFSLVQGITATGGTIRATTNLERIDLFETETIKGSTSYLNAPISISFFQPIFGFNQLKWDKKIEPVRYEEATREFSEEMEQIAFDAAQFFFAVFTEQLNVEAAERQKNNADTLLSISSGRYGVGKIAETDLLQIELRAKNADANLARARLDLQSTSEQLRNFLGLKTPVLFNLTPPENIPTYTVDVSTALQQAKKNLSQPLAFQRQLLEVDQEVAIAKAQSGPSLNLFARFGLSQRADRLGGIFEELLDQEVVNLGITVPVADWGKGKSRRAIAESNRELIQMTVSQDRINFERSVQLRVQQFDLVRDQVDLAFTAYEVSQKRQEITQQRYLIGKISLTDLNIAIDEQEAARRSYIDALRNFWLAHYQLRTLTLYDFEQNVSLVRSVDR